MIKNILKTIILVGPTILPIALLHNRNSLGDNIIGSVALIFCIYFLLSIWGQNLLLKIPIFFHKMLFILSFFAWPYLLFMNPYAFAPSGGECHGCINLHILIAKNGEKLDLNEAKITQKSGTDGFLDCSCGKVFSYEDNSEYALFQIQKMGDYWQHLPDCSAYRNDYYVKETSFDLNGECYLHKEDIRNDADTTVIYNKKTNKLLYLFYS